MSFLAGRLKFPGSRFKLQTAPLILSAILLLIAAAGGRVGQAQSAESANAGRAMLSVGAAASGYTLQYGDRKILGFSAWVDADPIRRFGLEAEVRRLEYHQTANVHAETYLGGVRYHLNY